MWHFPSPHGILSTETRLHVLQSTRGLVEVKLDVGAKGLNTVKWKSPFNDAHITVEWYDVWEPDRYWSGDEEVYVWDFERMQKVTRSRVSPVTGLPVAQDVQGFLFTRSEVKRVICYCLVSASDDIFVKRFKPRLTAVFDPNLQLPTTSEDSQTGKESKSWTNESVEVKSSYSSTVPNAKNVELAYKFTAQSNDWTATIKRTSSITDVPFSQAVVNATSSGSFPNSSGAPANTVIGFVPGKPVPFETPACAYPIAEINSAETVYSQEISSYQAIPFGIPSFGGNSNVL